MELMELFHDLLSVVLLASLRSTLPRRNVSFRPVCGFMQTCRTFASVGARDSVMREMARRYDPYLTKVLRSPDWKDGHRLYPFTPPFDFAELTPKEFFNTIRPAPYDLTKHVIERARVFAVIEDADEHVLTLVYDQITNRDVDEAPEGGLIITKLMFDLPQPLRQVMVGYSVSIYLCWDDVCKCIVFNAPCGKYVRTDMSFGDGILDVHADYSFGDGVHADVLETNSTEPNLSDFSLGFGHYYVDNVGARKFTAPTDPPIPLDEQDLQQHRNVRERWENEFNDAYDMNEHDRFVATDLTYFI